MLIYQYRAKETIDGPWLYGTITFAPSINTVFLLDQEDHMHIVIPETICCKTNIHDKNRQDIYENDIVKTGEFYHKSKHNLPAKTFKGVVKYRTLTTLVQKENESYRRVYNTEWYIDYNEPTGAYVCCDWSEFENCNIVGNIFDNRMDEDNGITERV